MTTPTPKPIPASVLREIATWPLDIADPEYTAILGNGSVCAMDLAAYALALQEAARALLAWNHPSHGGRPRVVPDIYFPPAVKLRNEADDLERRDAAIHALRALLPEGE